MMKNWSLISNGFSLVELLVVVTIVAILSVSSIVGFSYLGDILRAREVTGLISDVIKQEELKILRGDFGNSTIYFKADYLIVDENPEDADLQIELKNVCGADNKGYEIQFDQDGNLTKRDEEGQIVQIKNVTATASECIEFFNSPETEWNYQLNSNGEFSNTIRFIHFNLQRDNLVNLISIIQNAGAKLEILAPYGKKKIYLLNGTLPTTSPLELKVEDKNGNSSDTLTLQ